MASLTRRAFLRTCWVPAALWALTLLYIRPYDGWGAWAAAPLLLPSLVLSAVWGLVGLALVLVAASRDRRLDLPMVAGTLLSGSAAIYYTLSYLIRSAR